MDFFEAQDEARKRTGRLLGLFVLCMGGVVVSVSLLSWLAYGILGMSGEEGGELFGDVPWVWLGCTGLGTLVLILAASGSKSLALRGGGGVVAKDLGGRLVDPSTTDTHERQLLNVVEEMAIASGTPVPQVYVLDEDEGINAFAAGTEPGNAAIGVTRGCLLRLSRAELQGVIAHEFSHILNGDMKLNMRLIGWVFGLVILSILGRGLLHSLRFVRVGGSRENNAGGAIVLVMVVLGVGLMAIGGIGVLFARLLQAAVSRQREYLADASAVQFTREPTGIAGALKKIGGRGSRIGSPKAAEASHCFFADGGMFAFGFATHPPLEVRISRIEQDWDGEFVESRLPEIAHQRGRATGRRGDERVAGFAGVEQLAVAERVDARTGGQLYGDLKGEWLEACRVPDSAQALVFGLLLAEDDELRAGELEYLAREGGGDAAELAIGWQGELGALHSAQKIALVDLVIPTLRRLSGEEYERFVGISRTLIGSDGRVDLFEYMLQHVMEHHLGVHFEKRAPQRIAYDQVSQIEEEVGVILSAFARLDGNPEESFEQGVKGLGLGLVLKDGISLTAIDAALRKLESASPLLKKEVLEGCARVVGADGEFSSREAELLRATADSIGCSIPPFVGQLRLEG
ncbi:MAG: M48 family metallopeptidase [Verrucomicrobiota bacterium]